MRAGIFIDGAYLINFCRNAGVDIDHAKFEDHVMVPIRRRMPTDLLRAYYYHCAPWVSENPTDDEAARLEHFKRFMAPIESIPRWEVRLGKLEKRWKDNRDVFEQKRVDVLLSVDLVRHAAAGHLQHAVLVAGDSDFIPAVEAAKKSGVTMSLWCGERNTVHDDLIVLADEVHLLDTKTLPTIPRRAKPTVRAKKPAPHPAVKKPRKVV